MIKLGSYDPRETQELEQAACKAYDQHLKDTTNCFPSEITSIADRIKLQRYVPSGQPLTVAELQTRLRDLGFFPGADIDGIAGYRTQSAIRLFQEYVRSVEGQPCLPDGCYGKGTHAHMERWWTTRPQTKWAPVIERWRGNALDGSEYAEWLTLLDRLKAEYAAGKTRMLQLVNATDKKSDTRKPAEWDASPRDNVHFLGIRRTKSIGQFDDVFVLLIKGLVFKFQGSTDPGVPGSSAGAAFLVQGQHSYRFGWHRSQYLALRPRKHGVLIVRSKNDVRLDESELTNQKPEVNASINIHWGGRGMAAKINNWSEGCQVINGSLYLDAENRLIDCREFAAINNDDVANHPNKTRAAYNVLVDLVAALGHDLTGNTLTYTLMLEQDLALSQRLREQVAADAARLCQFAS